MPKVGVVTAKAPAAATLRRYGMTADEWLTLLARQGGVCAICSKPSKYFVIDHEHPPIKVWRKMTKEQRRLMVRGILCSHCNHRCLGRFVTLEKARAVVRYLETYETWKATRVAKNHEETDGE